MSTLRLSAVGLTLRVALLIVVVANALILARVLRPEGFGQYFLFLRLVSVLAALADLGEAGTAERCLRPLRIKAREEST